ncbi:MAG: LAO/AO transport system kinase [Halobacteriales archaeon]|jgi:LAO/AO transport system kinase
MNPDASSLVEDLLEGDHRALARVITKIENREPGYREIISALYDHTGDADIIGLTGSPGAGKSTLVDELASHYRDRGLTVGIIAVDPSSPYSGGAVLGDRIRMTSNSGDMDVFFRSMGARGNLGGLSTATGDAVKALDAFGKDKILIETVGAGQNEVDVVKTADTVAVLVPPASGDAIQTLKAGILEIGDLFVVNKADLEGADRTVQELREMIQMSEDYTAPAGGGHHGIDQSALDSDDEVDEDDEPDEWTPRIVETVATESEGIDELVETLQTHREYLGETGELERKVRERNASEIRTLLRNDVSRLLEDEIERQGGIDELVDAVMAGETNPYEIAEDIVDPIENCLEDEDT